MAQRLEEGQQDPLHIFFEFDDPLRQQLVQQIVHDDEFLDLDVLKKMANARTTDERDRRTNDLRRVSRLYDVAGVWAYEERKEEDETVDLPLESGIRDGHQCVVTKRGLPLIESAYILPKKLNGTNNLYLETVDYWNWLTGFWGEEKVSRLQSLLLSEGTMDMERLYNRITLEVMDRTEMQISLHWLPLKENMPGVAKHARFDLVSTLESPYQDPKYRPCETPGRNNVVFHTETGVRITSGYVFTVKTDNKDEWPLPSMELLELRWHLSRIAHMQGADGYYSPFIME
ncbi:hypothetical protein N7519_007140 [Penicillium mononematosum]|uniref:uncharacterized protein n=1 Tax=Penicillium mononematosum TaxID=268346 RepID=UPI002548CCE7|nr:uncharacterized protein N7519_007140 [Penicillium mononematosum]KAJ6185839.1 hypothetical protein N7519_007140 [Penicillium mononematosum]